MRSCGNAGMQSLPRRAKTAHGRRKTRGYTQSGRIRVLGMRFWGKHGANPGERDRAQPIDVDVSLLLDIAPAATSDDLARTLDYATLFRTCEQVVSKRSFRLLETLADALAEAIWAQHPLQSLRVSVRKPRLLEGATPEVEVRRRRT